MQLLLAIGRVTRLVFDRLFTFALVTAQLCLGAMVILTFINVFMRYVLNSGIFWAEEVALVLAVWFIFISLPLGVRLNLHISINLLRAPSARLNRVLDVLKGVVVLAVGYVLLHHGVVLIQFTSRSIMPATELPSSLLYLVVPLSAVLLLYEAITDILGIDTTTARESANDG